jgi:hypothetical protein
MVKKLLYSSMLAILLAPVRYASAIEQSAFGNLFFIKKHFPGFRDKFDFETHRY